MIRDAALAFGFVLAGSLAWEPTILTMRWPDGHEERVAATNATTCATAVRAIGSGLWQPESAMGSPSATCQPGNLFRPGSDCIRGHSCPGDR